MNKKRFIIILSVFVLLTINFSVAQEIDNSTDDILQNDSLDTQVLEASDGDVIQEASKTGTHLDVESNTTFDVVGDYFKVKLSDENNNSIANTNLLFTVVGKTYKTNTDSNGVASLQINLMDGTYDILTRFAGSSVYNSSAITTTVIMNNTRIVDAGLTNSEIQNIIDNAKAKNIILFKGNSYADVNLIIDKRLTLITDSGTTLKSSSSSPAITINGKGASYTSIKGFNIRSGGDGIKVNGAECVSIYGNDISCKGNGIVSTGTKYLNITDNNINKNSKSGVIVTESSYVYIFNNKITNNGVDGIGIAKSNKVYVHGNTISGNKISGISFSKSVNGKSYSEGPGDVHINKNTISKNGANGIYIKDAGNGININSNDISKNKGNGIAIANIGTNSIKSNLITENLEYGIKFFDNYVKPNDQDISYNVIYANTHMDVEAKDTYYQENGVRLDLGDNWYTDNGLICPKIKTNGIKFSVTQIGPNKYQALFTDSNGNIASLLPDRTLTYQTNNGQKVTMTIKGGAAVFTVDAENNDIVKATVDNSRRDNTHNLDTESSEGYNGQSPEYTYPSIPQDDLYDMGEDVGDGMGDGTGNGNGNGQGHGGNTNKGNGNSQQESSDNTGNSTYSQDMDPGKATNNQVNDVSQPQSAETTSQASASEAGRANDASSGSQSVVKQIIIDEDDIVRVAGISFIILLIFLTIAFYYRDDIKEMKSKM